MKINFRQGLISYQTSGSQPLFLLPSTTAGYITLNVSTTPTIATIAHGGTDYLLKFDATVPNAWGPMTPNVDNYLFIDQNVISGALTYGATTLEPITSSVAPSNPIAGQLWFDLNVTVMKTFNGTKWIDTPRLVVAKVPFGNINQIVSYTTGSSVGLSVPGSPGFLMLDSQLRPLRTSSGELLTSDTAVRIKTTVGSAGVLSEPVNNFIPVRAAQPIPEMSLVYFSGEDAVSLASSDPSLVDPKSPIGIVQMALGVNEIGVVTQSGEIVSDQFAFGPNDFGKALYCGFNGELTTTRPQSIQVYRVGYVKNTNTILFYIDSETSTLVTAVAGTIVSGVPPLSAVTAQNQFGEVVATVSMPAVTTTTDGYMTAAGFSQLSSFNTRITSNTTSISTLQASKADVAHTHVIADVTGLQADLDALTASIGTKVSKLLGAANHFIGVDAQGALVDSTYAFNAFALVGHTHTIADVTNLQTALDAKANVVHTHVIADITGLQMDLDNKAFVNHTHVIADVNGLQTALNGKAPLIHTHIISDVVNLQTALDARSLVGHTHVIADVTNLQTTFDNKAALVHQHVSADITDLDSVTGTLKVKTVSGDYTLVLSDMTNSLIRVSSATSARVFLPSNATLPAKIGSTVLIGWTGTGVVSIAPENSDVVINTPDTLIIARRHGKVTAMKVGMNEWDLEGNLQPIGDAPAPSPSPSPAPVPSPAPPAPTPPAPAPVTGKTVVTLQNGVAGQDTINTNGDGYSYFKITVPAGRTSLQFAYSGSSPGEFGSYKLGRIPTDVDNDGTFGNTTYGYQNISNPAPGDYYVRMQYQGGQSYQTVNVTATFVPEQQAPTIQLTSGSAVTYNYNAAGLKPSYSIDVPAGQSYLHIESTGSSDIYVFEKFGQEPDPSHSVFDYYYNNPGHVDISSPAAGTYYLELYSNATSGTYMGTLTATFGTGAAPAPAPTGGTGLPPPSNAIELPANTPMTINGLAGEDQYYFFDVPSNATAFDVIGGSYDSAGQHTNMNASFDSGVTLTQYDVGGERNFPYDQVIGGIQQNYSQFHVGRWYLLVHGIIDYPSYTLTYELQT